jgi:hypothetical protein
MSECDLFVSNKLERLSLALIEYEGTWLSMIILSHRRFDALDSRYSINGASAR